MPRVIRRLHPPRSFAATLVAPFAPRSLGVLLCALIAFPTTLAGTVLVVVGLVAGGLLSWTTPGLWLIAFTVRAALAFGDVQRSLTGVLPGCETAPAASRRPSGQGAFGWRRALLTQRDGWRAVGYVLTAPLVTLLPVCAAAVVYVYGLLLFAHPLVKHWNQHTVRRLDGTLHHVSLEVGGVQLDSWPRWLLPVAAGAVLLLIAPWVLRNAVAPHRLLQRALLGPSAADRRDLRIRTLEETRAQAVGDAAATLRRIERDLHDGTQARLVGLGMHLTMIRELVGAGADREQVLAVLDTASNNAKAAVADLRDLVRGIHPPVLDQGLETALATLAADGPLPVDLTADILVRPAPAVESITYFCAAELLANAAKHSGASRTSVDVRARKSELRLTVRDDGRGGAVTGAGSGLSGLLARVRTVDGTLTCDSPPGGPTVVTVLLPALLPARQQDG